MALNAATHTLYAALHVQSLTTSTLLSTPSIRLGTAQLEEGGHYASSVSKDVTVGVAAVLSVSARPDGKVRVHGHRFSKTLADRKDETATGVDADRIRRAATCGLEDAPGALVRPPVDLKLRPLDAFGDE
jgi:hypothetical protein